MCWVNLDSSVLCSINNSYKSQLDSISPSHPFAPVTHKFIHSGSVDADSVIKNVSIGCLKWE